MIRLDSDLIPTWLRMDLVLNWIIQNFCNWKNSLDVNCQNQLFEPIFLVVIAESSILLTYVMKAV